MIIIIDGYNVLKQMISYTVSEKERNNYIAMLRRYARKRKHDIVIVFDGGTSPWPERIQEEKVLIIYAGTKYSADDIIMHYLDEKRGHDFLLVTSDRAIIQFAKQQSVVAISGTLFNRYVTSLLLPTSETVTAKKTDTYIRKLSIPERTTGEEKEVDILMFQDTTALSGKAEDENGARSEKEYFCDKKDKKNRLLAKQLGKL